MPRHASKNDKRKRRGRFVRLHRRRCRQRGLRARGRLSESGRHRVLLLEAGPQDRNIWIHVPIGYAKLFTDARHNWLYNSEPEPELERPLDHPAARQGDGRLVVDQRAALSPRPGRGLRPLAPARQCRLELRRRAAVLPPLRGPAARRGRSARRRRAARRSPMSASRIPLCDAFIDACAQAGLPRNDDFNGPSQEGAGYFQLTARNGRRCVDRARLSQADARRRPNLRVDVERADDAHPVRGAPRRRRRVSPRTARRTRRAQTAR